MNDEHTPSLPARDPDQTVPEFLDVFADWLVQDARPTIAWQTRRLRQLAPGLDDAGGIDLLIEHLEDVLGRLDHLAAAIFDRPTPGRTHEVEALAAASADRCSEARDLIGRARFVISGPAAGDRRSEADRGCRLPPD